MRTTGLACVLLASSLMIACESAQPPPIDTQAIGKVQAEIKRQVGLYMLAARDAPVRIKIDGREVDVRTNPELFWCGNGNVDFELKQVRAQLKTALGSNVGASISVSPEVPLAPSGKIRFERAVQNSQLLEYNQWPFDLALQPDEFRRRPAPNSNELATAPIAQVLLSLRQAQILGATIMDYSTGTKRTPQPCFSNYDPAKPAADPGNSFTIGLSITTKVDGEVSVGVAPVQAGLSAGIGIATGHELKVTFSQRDITTLQLLRDRVDEACKPPNALSSRCTAITSAYDKLRTTGEYGDEARRSALLPPTHVDAGGNPNEIGNELLINAGRMGVFGYHSPGTSHKGMLGDQIRGR